MTSIEFQFFKNIYLINEHPVRCPKSLGSIWCTYESPRKTQTSWRMLQWNTKIAWSQPNSDSPKDAAGIWLQLLELKQLEIEMLFVHFLELARCLVILFRLQLFAPQKKSTIRTLWHELVNNLNNTCKILFAFWPSFYWVVFSRNPFKFWAFRLTNSIPWIV